MPRLLNHLATGDNGFWSGSCVWSGAEKVTGILWYRPICSITEYPAGQINQAEERITDQPKNDGCNILIGEIDGSMIPIVKVDEEAEDKRKNKTLQWKEARLG